MAEAVIEMAIGGKTATQKYEGEKRFDIRIRYDKAYRKNEDDIRMIPSILGNKVPHREIATIHRHRLRKPKTPSHRHHRWDW